MPEDPITGTLGNLVALRQDVELAVGESRKAGTEVAVLMRVAQGLDGLISKLQGIAEGPHGDPTVEDNRGTAVQPPESGTEPVE